MKIVAWIVLCLIAFNVTSEPFMYGRPRSPYGTQTWISAMLGAALLMPLIGRVLGWW